MKPPTDKIPHPAPKNAGNAKRTGKARVTNTMPRAELLRMLRETGRGDWITHERGPVAHPESDLQQKCVRWAHDTHRDLLTAWNAETFRYEPNGLLHSCPNGMRVKPSQARVAIAEGLVSGVSDLELDIARGGWHGLKIEMKNGKKGRVSDAQKRYAEAVRSQGFRYEIARDFDEFCTLFDDYLNSGD